MSDPIRAVMFDWAGTLVDYGSFAPVLAFQRLFATRGIEVMPNEIRPYMGMLKRRQLAAVAAEPAPARQWRDRFGAEPTDAELDTLYAEFEPILHEVFANTAAPVPGALELLADLRGRGIPVGSTTGYTRSTMNLLVSAAAAHGLRVDAVVCSDEVPTARPSPLMCYNNALKLNAWPLHRMVKIGDATVDVEEGRAAGMWTIAVLKGGSLLGLTGAETEALSEAGLRKHLARARRTLLDLGAHAVLDSILEVPAALDQIRVRIRAGNFPLSTRSINE